VTNHEPLAQDVSAGPSPSRVPPGPETLRDVQEPGAGVLALQRAAGNAAVGRLLAPSPEPRTETRRMEISAVIRRVDRDAEEDVAEHDTVDPAAVTDAFTLPAAQVPAATEGETAALPDIELPDALAVVDEDAVAGTITYSPTVNQAGTVKPFGSTKWNKFKITGTTVTAGKGTFTAKFTLENPITYNVSSPKTSIESVDDPALTNDNFTLAAGDLTPNMSKQGGKPPRTKFWARDLTVKHEKFHADERSKFGKAGSDQAQVWLSAQTAGSVDDVQKLIAQVPARVIASSKAAAGTVDEKESRAYGDGASSYKARADGIKARGAKGPGAGGYAAPPTK
jgi:hypothetical protein